MFSFFKQKSKRVYLDNAGATEIGARAERALIESLSLYGNPSGIHKEGVEAGLLLDKARALCATVLNAHAYEIYFVGSGTESCNISIMGTYNGYVKQEARSKKQEGGELLTTKFSPSPAGFGSLPHSSFVGEERITNNVGPLPHMIVSSIEHPAILEPIRLLEKEGKIAVTYLPVYENGIVKVHDIREALREETILVSVMYANNEIGTIQPVKEIGRTIEEWKKEQGRTHTAYPYFHIDACQSANYCNLDVVRLRAHLMTINSSKVYGPKGIALLYKREGIKIESVTLGGGQERGIRSGTENVAGAYAFGIALIEAVEMKDKESERLEKLRDFFFEKILKEIPEVTIYGDKKNRLPNNINIRVPGILSDEMIIRLDAKGFAVSHKSACASSESDGSYVLGALGASRDEALQNIRITLGRSTSRDDLDNLVKAIKDIVSKYVK